MLFGLFGAETVVIPWYATNTAKVTAATVAVVTGFVAARHFEREKVIESCDRIIERRKKFHEEEKASASKVNKAWRTYKTVRKEHFDLVSEHSNEIATEKGKIRKELKEVGYGLIFRTNHWKVPEIQKA